MSEVDICDQSLRVRAGDIAVFMVNSLLLSESEPVDGQRGIFLLVKNSLRIDEVLAAPQETPDHTPGSDPNANGMYDMVFL